MLGTVVLISLFNWLVDPFFLFGGITVKGFNAQKTEAERYQRLYKAYEAKRVLPDTIILGTSRALFLNEKHHALHNAYNLAITSATSYEQLRYFQHTHAIHSLKEVIWGLDFPFSSGSKPTFREDRLRSDKNGRLIPQTISSYLSDIVPSLLSIDALKSSVKTIRKQPSPELSSALQDKKTRVQKKGGQRKMFLGEERDILTHPLISYPDCMDNSPVNHLNPSVYDHFQTVVRQAYSEDITLRMFISPSHARYNEMLCAQGLWPHFEEWKKNIIKINEEEARLAHKTPFRIVDFSGYNDFTTENVPEIGDLESLMQWYWEGVHYTEELGDMILSCLSEERSENCQKFGVAITSTNINEHLKIIRSRRAKFIISHPDDIAEIKKMIVDITSR